MDLGDPPHAVILFDGVCNLCSGTVQFVLRRDKGGRFVFASLQSAAGRELLECCTPPGTALDTLVLVQDGRCLTRSDAALAVVRELRWPWSALGVFRIVPRFLRDRCYDWIAHHRYRWFGRRESCIVPSPDQRKRFLS